jgi:predicted RNase H-like nuclease
VKTLIIGVDCATKPNKTGLARGQFTGSRLVIDEIQRGSPQSLPVDVVAKWLKGVDRALLALDAPLGWPTALSAHLAKHKAGESLGCSADELFNRATDKDIRRRFGKRPLEVGANLIARTAHAALSFLDKLGTERGKHIPLAWEYDGLSGVAAIEVYPAITLLVHKIERRDSSLEELPPWVEVKSTALGNMSCPHTRDAVLCAISGADFVAGRAIAPNNQAIAKAKREGWIWSPSMRE